MSAPSYPDTMSAQRDVLSPSGKRAVYLFGGFRGFICLTAAAGALLALTIFFRDLSHDGRLPEWVATFASVTFVALIPGGAVACGLLERRRKAKAAAGGSGS